MQYFLALIKRGFQWIPATIGDQWWWWGGWGWQREEKVHSFVQKCRWEMRRNTQNSGEDEEAQAEGDPKQKNTHGSVSVKVHMQQMYGRTSVNPCSWHVTLLRIVYSDQIRTQTTALHATVTTMDTRAVKNRLCLTKENTNVSFK